MKLLAIPALFVALVAVAAEFGQPSSISIIRKGAQPAVVGAPEYFTGAVRVESQFKASDPSRVSVGTVTFEPGARSAWHTHPLGQTLIVTAGTGWLQQWGGSIQEMKQGDVVWTPPGVKHWHGATPTARVTHIAIQELQAGRSVEWLEKVSDAEYRR